MELNAVAKFVPISWQELRVGSAVYLPKGNALFTVKAIDRVIDVDLSKQRYGSHRIDLSKLEAIPFPEPRITLEVSEGNWYGYWYPSRQIFAVINNDSNWWELLVSTQTVSHVVIPNRTV